MDFGLVLDRTHRAPARSRRGRPGAWTALASWWLQARLDRALADGADPATDPKLAHRAQRITSPRLRRRVAASIECVIEEAEGAWQGMSSEAPSQRRQVLEARPALHMLTNRLVADVPVSPPGVAKALVLLADPSGPLYAHTPDHALENAAFEAADALVDGRPS